jgi:HAD superfamily hydrolase (TIGR01509 family)
MPLSFSDQLQLINLGKADPMEYKCVIFDSDGVLVDSETISASVFQEMAGELGLRMDFSSAVEQFSGSSMKENLQFIQEHISGALPSGFEKEFRARTYEAFKKDLKPVDGVRELIQKLRIPFCVASSGPPEKIRLNLGLVQLLEYFENKIFSSYDIDSWKPEPGIFLYAARSMGYEPEECVVIEDSAHGIHAALSGGFKVYALAKGENKKAFEQLGAIAFGSMKELEMLLGL